MSDLFMGTIYASMMESYTFNWKKCGLLYTLDAWGIELSNKFIEESEKRGIEILNDPEMRGIPVIGSSDDWELVRG